MGGYCCVSERRCEVLVYARTYFNPSEVRYYSYHLHQAGMCILYTRHNSGWTFRFILIFYLYFDLIPFLFHLLRNRLFLANTLLSFGQPCGHIFGGFCAKAEGVLITKRGNVYICSITWFARWSRDIEPRNRPKIALLLIAHLLR